MKCNECNNELEQNAKFCTNCGVKIADDTLKEIANSEPAPFLMKYTNLAISIFVGFFIFSINKVILSLLLMLLVKLNAVSVDNYESIASILLIVSIYLAVVFTKKLNKFKTKKVRIILRVVIIILGLIGGILIGLNNSMVRNNASHSSIQHK